MDDLIAFYKNNLRLQNAVFKRIEHEDAIVAIVYKVLQEDGDENILKICTRINDYLCEVFFLRYFENKIAVPRIIGLSEPTENIAGAILMECLKGDVLNKSTLTYSLLFEVGASLAKIHSNTVAGYGDLTKPHELSSEPSSYFTFKFEEGFDECSQHLPKKLLANCYDYYSSHVKLLSSVDGPCVVHRDFRPGNIIALEGKVQGIIDWSSARGSFAEEDFSPLELDDWGNDVNKKFFLEGYASVRPVPNYTAVMPLLRLNKAIASIGYTVKSNTWDNKNANFYQRSLQFLEEFFEIK